MSVETQLRGRLGEAADGLTPPAAPHPVAIRERARRRTRRTTVLRVASAVVLVLVAVTTVRNLVGDGSQRIAADPDEQGYRRPTDVELHGELPPDEVRPPEWRVVDGALGENFGGFSISWTGSRFVLIGQAFDTGLPVLSTSVDGEIWTPPQSYGKAGWYSSVAELDGSLYIAAELTTDDGLTSTRHLLRLDTDGSWTDLALPAEIESADPQQSVSLADVTVFDGAVYLSRMTWSDQVGSYLTAQGVDLLETNGYGLGEENGVVTITVYETDGTKLQDFTVSIDELSAYGVHTTTEVLRFDPSSGSSAVVAQLPGESQGPLVAKESGLFLGTMINTNWGLGAAADGATLWRVDGEEPVAVDTTNTGMLQAIEADGEWFVEQRWGEGLVVRSPDGPDQYLPYVQDLTGGPAGFVGVGWAYNPRPSLLEQGMDALGSLFGEGRTSRPDVVTVSSDGVRWSWQESSEVFPDTVDWIIAASGDDRIVAVGTASSSSGSSTTVAVTDLGS